MHCTNCGQETEIGAFCTNCGTELNTEQAATLNNNPDAANQSEEQTENSSNETVKKLRIIGDNFSHFFMTLIKKPDAAIRANYNDFTSASITMTIFSLFIALSTYLAIHSTAGPRGMFVDVSFIDHFLVPFLSFVIIFGAIGMLTFAALRMIKSELSFKDALAKYGAYLVPFFLLYVFGFLLTLINLKGLAVLIFFISIFGSLILAPTFIILSQNDRSMDRIYILIGFYIISLLLFWVVVQSISTVMIQTHLENIIGNFGY
ncbi:hypothetical protein SAMN05216389_10422 [Oceanobacillus limi]|uniref:Zinc-ribbon domain-containing protein n=1 Tax=Oceanobacillus limi TaxID=930131 RepID=A0A1I0ASM4_9BACI|nr:hypothetical protein [Oceanobacillus limi]SES97392.1 hypothetical protein SAMN05216389_10422 [Oceanobacillus limi]